MSEPIIFHPRTYRDFSEDTRFKTFRVTIETSDLYVKAHSLLEKETENLIRQGRNQVEAAIARRPAFLSSLTPLEENPSDAPIAAWMIRAGAKAGTGPMAAVAGAIAEFVGRGLLAMSDELIVENGGDIFLKMADPVLVGIFAGSSPFNERLGLLIEPSGIPIGICTSAATVGPSLSLGKADAATVISHDVALADAVATAMGNRISKSDDLKEAVEWAKAIPGVDGALAIMDEKISAVGIPDLVPIPGRGTDVDEVRK
jgi:ApbE superfamily uncharacterized protein (UPF0280 family)